MSIMTMRMLYYFYLFLDFDTPSNTKKINVSEIRSVSALWWGEICYKQLSPIKRVLYTVYSISEVKTGFKSMSVFLRVMILN
jgi:hypothetical protein